MNVLALPTVRDVTVKPWFTDTFESNVALGTQVIELPTVRDITVIVPIDAVPDVVRAEQVTAAAVVAPLSVQGPDTLRELPRVVAAVTVSG